MEEFENYANKGFILDKKTYTRFQRLLQKNDPYANIFIKNNEKIFIFDSNNYVRIALKVIPILSLIKKDNNKHIIMTSVGERNKSNKLYSELSKYRYSQALQILNELNKKNEEDLDPIWGIRSLVDNDYFNYMTFSKSTKINGLQSNFENLNTYCKDLILYILGKSQNKAYININKNDISKFFLILDYDIIKGNTYRINDIV
jgi:hypothetical protein